VYLKFIYTIEKFYANITCMGMLKMMYSNCCINNYIMFNLIFQVFHTQFTVFEEIQTWNLPTIKQRANYVALVFRLTSGIVRFGEGIDP
jgi:hypothetical protein